MKRVTIRDYLCIAAVGALLVFLALGAGKGKGKNVPLDERHRSCYEGLKNGRSRSDCELLCVTCHSNSSIPLPKNHPPKEQCLICHLLADRKQ